MYHHQRQQQQQPVDVRPQQQQHALPVELSASLTYNTTDEQKQMTGEAVKEIHHLQFYNYF
jgi:hypothetical protein